MTNGTQTPRPFQWTGKRELAARLLAEDTLPDREIAAQCGITVRQILRWKVRAEFRSRVESIVEQIRKAQLAEGIASKRNRIDGLNDRWQRMRRVLEERAKQHENIDTLQASPAAGASTGLMVLTIRHLPGGGRVEEWSVDTGLLKELRDHERQAAQELGQWIEKGEISGNGGGPLKIVVEYADADDHVT